MSRVSRRRLAPMAAAVAAALLGFAWPADAAPGLPEGRFAAIVTDDATGEVIYARYADQLRYPASLTKVMTLYLVYEALEDGRLKLSDPVTISPRAAGQPPTRLGLKAGDRLTVAEAIDVLVVKSANDVATALAERIAGTEAAFARRMTRQARELGMMHTTYRNASGLPARGHVTTARDLARLAHAMRRDHPSGYGVFAKQQAVFRGRVIRGHNRLLTMPGVDGLKTGYINASGFNLMSSGVRDGRRIDAVVLGGRTAASRDSFMRRLLDASFTTLAVRYAGFTTTVSALLSEPGQGGGRPAAAARPSADASRRTAAARSSPPGRWSVQVGAFPSRATGRQQLRRVRARGLAALRHAETLIVARGRFQVARFVGLTEREAREACRAITARKGDCLALQTAAASGASASAAAGSS